MGIGDLLHKSANGMGGKPCKVREMNIPFLFAVCRERMATVRSA